MKTCAKNRKYWSLLVIYLLLNSKRSTAFDFLQGVAPFEAPNPGDFARHLVDEMAWESLLEMDRRGLQKKEVPQSPWSGWYWPLRNAGIAYRYRDPKFPLNAPWSQVRKYLTSTLGKTPMALLSPAEKYDLLMNDSNFTLTRAMLAWGDRVAVQDRIEEWNGFCTGWANSAMMMPRPTQSVSVLAADGRTLIAFLPDDLKALAALLWSTGAYAFRSSGTLCGENPVARDPTTGRALNPACRDTNPGTFHLALVNQIGHGQRSLLIDSDPGYEVWNQPLRSYTYTYFHPKTLQPGDYASSLIRRTEWEDDPLKASRANGTHAIIGIKMSVTFIYEKEPNALGRRDAEPKETTGDEIRTPEYSYELELSSQNRILGGEWKTSLHPDLLWVAQKDSFPITRGDRLINEAHPQVQWTTGTALPREWRESSLESARLAQPLGRIVARLFDWAQASPLQPTPSVRPEVFISSNAVPDPF